MSRDEPPPEYCSRCGAYVGPDNTPIPGLFSIPTVKAKSMDSTYRLLESSSEERAKAAAAELDVPVSEMSHLKVTDMNDNMREGDVAAKITPVKNDVTIRMDQMKQAGLPVGFTQVNGTGQNGSANAMADNIRQMHPGVVAQTAKAGEVGRYSTKK